MTIIRYFSRMGRIWIIWAFALADLIAFVIGLIGTSYKLPQWVYWLIAASGFLIANIKLFADMQEERAFLQRQIDDIASTEANLVLRVISTSFSHVAPILTTKGRFNDGIDHEGMPIQARLYARLEVENKGFEDGKLEWKINLEDSSLPTIFSISQDNKDGEFETFLGILHGRSRTEDYWRIEYEIAADNSYEFAKSLPSLKEFDLVLSYRTKRIGGQTCWQSLHIKEDFSQYRYEVIRRWHARKLSKLVAIADSDPM